MVQKTPRRVGLAAASLVALAVIAGVARAQDPSPEDLRARVERLEKQNQELINALKNLGPRASIGFQEGGGAPDGKAALSKDDVKKIIDDRFKQDADKKKKEEDEKKLKLEQEGFKIGSDLSMKATWNDGVLISTVHKDFWMHIGGWIQYDNVFWNQSDPLRVIPGARPGAKQGVASGAALGGIGNLQDGTYFPRTRIHTEGVFWENCEFNLILAMENLQFEETGLDEFWIGFNKIPS